jgi:hypothetical protein
MGGGLIGGYSIHKEGLKGVWVYRCMGVWVYR